MEWIQPEHGMDSTSTWSGFNLNMEKLSAKPTQQLHPLKVCSSQETRNPNGMRLRIARATYFMCQRAPWYVNKRITKTEHSEQVDDHEQTTYFIKEKLYLFSFYTRAIPYSNRSG